MVTVVFNGFYLSPWQSFNQTPGRMGVHLLVEPKSLVLVGLCCSVSAKFNQGCQTKSLEEKKHTYGEVRMNIFSPKTTVFEQEIMNTFVYLCPFKIITFLERYIYASLCIYAGLEGGRRQDLLLPACLPETFRHSAQMVTLPPKKCILNPFPLLTDFSTYY